MGLEWGNKERTICHWCSEKLVVKTFQELQLALDSLAVLGKTANKKNEGGKNGKVEK